MGIISWGCRWGVNDTWQGDWGGGFIFHFQELHCAFTWNGLYWPSSTFPATALNTVDRADLHISEHPFSLNGSPWPAPETRVEDFGERWEKYAKTDQRRPDPFMHTHGSFPRTSYQAVILWGPGFGGVPVCCLKASWFLTLVTTSLLNRCCLLKSQVSYCVVDSDPIITRTIWGNAFKCTHLTFFFSLILCMLWR